MRPHHQEREVGARGDCSVGFGERLFEHLLLERAALLVEPVEQDGYARRFHLVLAGEQARSQTCVTDAPAGIDARPQDEAEVIGRRRLVQARGVAQRLEADILAPTHHLQPLRDIGAVQAGERHHVGDGCQRHEVELAHKVGLG